MLFASQKAPTQRKPKRIGPELDQNPHGILEKCSCVVDKYSSCEEYSTMIKIAILRHISLTTNALCLIQLAR